MTDRTDPMQRLRSRLGGIAYGGDYNPEQWDESVWDTDIDLMRAAGVNLVTLGVFSWSLLEPAEGQYDFGWLDTIMGKLDAAGISVCLATPTAAPPAWMAQRYPQTLPMTADGVRLRFGSRCHFCASSPIYRRKSREIAAALATHYRDHPALALWHVNNEYGQDCYCDVSGAHFRAWLQERYGSVKQVNTTWGTTFWGQVYTDWDQIEPPRTATGTLNPARVLDYRRFASAALLECFTGERDELRRHAPGIPITTNFMTSFKPLDYRRWAVEQDVVSVDAYPDPSDQDSMVEAAMNYDLMRSLRGGQPWLLMEQATSATNWRTRNSIRPPGAMRVGTFQAIARGADSAMFFQWRASRTGAERFHSGMLPHAGTDTRVWREVVGLGAELRRVGELAGARTSARVAMVFDWDAWWALEGEPRLSVDVGYVREALRYYRELWTRNVAVDLVAADADLSPYALVVVPTLFALSEQQAGLLERYVDRGGHLLVSFATGLVDQTNAAHLDGYPGPLRDVLGVSVEELNPLQVGERLALCDPAGVCTAHGMLWQDMMSTTTASVLLSYADGRTPAVTRNRFGTGEATYVSTALDPATLGGLVDTLLARAAVEYHPSPPGVEIVIRETAGERYRFVLNHRPEAVTVDIGASALDLLTATTLAGPVLVDGYGVLVLSGAAT